MSGTSFSIRADNYIAEIKRVRYRQTRDPIKHKYIMCPRCHKSMPRDEYCPSCGWTGKGEQ